jgi:hypothetical protein
VVYDQADAGLKVFGQQGVAQGDDVVAGDDDDAVGVLSQLSAQCVVVGRLRRCAVLPQRLTRTAAAPPRAS